MVSVGVSTLTPGTAASIATNAYCLKSDNMENQEVIIIIFSAKPQNDHKLPFQPSSINHVKISSHNYDVENDTTTNMLINFEEIGSITCSQ